MSFIQRLVSPKLPTALATHSHVELNGYDLFLHHINNVHVLPTELDVSKFDEALSKVLQLYPHVAGRLRCSDGHWFIELTNSAVPVQIDYKLDTSSDSLLNGDWVIQDDISPFLNDQPTGPTLINSGVPLLRFKLTFFNNETCVGVSWSHTLGDAIVLSRFMHTLSQFYQGLAPKYAAPTFKKPHIPTSSCPITDQSWPRMSQSHYIRPFTETELDGMFSEKCKNVEHLRWRFDSHDLAELRSALSGQKGTYLSQQDCLTAYLVAILNYNRSISVQHVVNISSFRNISAPFVDEYVVGNLIQDIPATVPTDMAGIATALRHALIECRDPEYIYNRVFLAHNTILEAASVGRSPFFTFQGHIVGVNSNVGIDWCSAHFGYPDGSRFHTHGVFELYMRCFKSNPTKGDDGVWRARPSVDVSFGVGPELKPNLLETLALGVQHALNNERSQTV